MSEQARNDVRNSLMEAAEDVKSIQEKEKIAQKLTIDENTELKEANVHLMEVYVIVEIKIIWVTLLLLDVTSRRRN